MNPTGRPTRIRHTSGTRERAENIAADSIKAACDAFLQDSNAMNNRRTIHESKPATGPRRWTRKKADITPPSMKPDWPAIVAAGIAAGLVKPPKRQP